MTNKSYEMLQEDSNGDTGFEFVEKKTDELSLSGETAGLFSIIHHPKYDSNENPVITGDFF